MCNLFLIILIVFANCSGQSSESKMSLIETGADQIEKYFPIIKNKKVAIVANHTSLVNDKHLVDTLLSRGIEMVRIMKVFVPEHGFRGDFDAGEVVKNEIDSITGLPIVSLYGGHKKPLPEDLSDLDLVIFDIQDVGARFYTYISTLHYVMEACAEHNIPLLLLDRPNPNSGYVDGPILEKENVSFIGLHPIPIVYGMTIGEFAQMINGEGWLKNGVKCNLKVIPCQNYYHGKPVSLPIKPSPNLPNEHSVRLYPSMCLFEGTVISEGRGTMVPFEVYGHPELDGDFSFIPMSIPGMAKYPRYKNKECYGEDLRNFIPKEGWNKIYLDWLIDSYNKFPNKEEFFTSFFKKLAGTESLQKQIESGISQEDIRKSWQQDLEEFKEIRKKYLIYEDFE
ncbi:exo-beta-N-acetylmuramidase NamZ domain-containing protein [Bacteroidota bacterium]